MAVPASPGRLSRKLWSANRPSCGEKAEISQRETALARIGLGPADATPVTTLVAYTKKKGVLSAGRQGLGLLLANQRAL